MNFRQNKTEVKSGIRFPQLLGEGVKWEQVPIGTAITIAICKLEVIPSGYQGQPFIGLEGVYVPETVTTVEEVEAQAQCVTIKGNTTILNAIDRGSIKIGSVVELKYLGKVDKDGKPVNYYNFEISTFNNEALDEAIEKVWVKGANEPILKGMYSVPKGANIFLVDGIMQGQPPVTPVGQPAVGQPAVGQPAVGQPAVGQPAVGQPAVGQPAVGQPAVGQPAVGQPAVGQPATGGLSLKIGG